MIKAETIQFSGEILAVKGPPGAYTAPVTSRALAALAVLVFCGAWPVRVAAQNNFESKSTVPRPWRLATP
jgi:hypothetical protein